MASKRIDHAEAASRFIKAKDNAEFHDRRLWDLRQKARSREEPRAGMGDAAHARVAR